MSLACIFLYVILIIIAFALTLKLYFILTTGWCRSQQCLVGKTAIVTGANTGIGYETAIDFAKRGAKVILACRNPDKAKAAQNRIISGTGNPNISFRLIDFSSYDSVRKFANEINETETHLDILVNNAGAAFTRATFNKESRHLELMQVNYFSGFLLTNLLGDLLKKSGSSRVINVSSALARLPLLDVNNLNRDATLLFNYSNTKACNILFTRELAKRLENSNSKVTTYSLHPGGVNSDIFGENRFYSIHLLYNCVIRFYYRSVLAGAQTVIYASVAQGIERHNGEHFEECARVEPYKSVRSPKLAKKLWEKSAEAVQLQPFECQL